MLTRKDMTSFDISVSSENSGLLFTKQWWNSVSGKKSLLEISISKVSILVRLKHVLMKKSKMRQKFCVNPKTIVAYTDPNVVKKHTRVLTPTYVSKFFTSWTLSPKFPETRLCSVNPWSWCHLNLQKSAVSKPTGNYWSNHCTQSDHHTPPIGLSVFWCSLQRFTPCWPEEALVDWFHFTLHQVRCRITVTTSYDVPCKKVVY